MSRDQSRDQVNYLSHSKSKDLNKRLYKDYCKLNNAIIRDRYLLPSA